MKNSTKKYFFAVTVSFILIACSTRKDSFTSRNLHALSTKYNILYNGGVALDKGLVDLKTKYQDNFWEILPVERMQIKEDKALSDDAKNSNFERAETKAIKSIQKHSMNIDGTERNPQMDEAHLMLGKARYYDQRFVPALEAFNYVLYKYPKSDKIYEVKIWREKTNMRLDNDALAIKNLRILLKEIKFKDQIFADANATLAQAFLNLGEKDSAIAKIKIAKEFTKSNEEVSRYNFILGQLYESQGFQDSAYASYQDVINMKRKAARQYVIQSHAHQAKQFDYEKGDTIAFLEKFNDLLKDRENRPYLDVLNHQMGIFYDKKKNYSQAKKFYNLSLKTKSQDTYLNASNYRNLADIYFNSAKYVTAGKYYDSTLVHLKPRTREYNAIKKKRENLDDVIKYEGIAQKNDSIISLYKMTDDQRVVYFNEYIDKLKKEDEKKQKELEKQETIKENQERDGKPSEEEKVKSKTKTFDGVSKNGENENSSFQNKKGSDFYFYNPSTVAYGRGQFQKLWGKIKLSDNWRVASKKKDLDKQDADTEQEQKTDESATISKVSVDDKYSAKSYIDLIPTSQTVIDSLSKERNFAYYQLGVIYKEKFKEYQLAANKLEQLLKNNPEERLVLPSMYNLYKLYQILDKRKAEDMKARIIAQYPDSRYAQILQNPENEIAEATDSPKAVYEKLYKKYEEGEFKTVYNEVNTAINRFTGDEYVPKFELLKANLIGKLNGLAEYKKALNFVALNFPNLEEGKTAEKLLTINIPKLEVLQLAKYPSSSWKVLYQTKDFEDKNTKTLREKLDKFIKGRSLDKLSVSLDIYNMTDNFVVIHGMTSEESAKGIASVLKEVKEYQVKDIPIIICSENYSIVQIKKNLDDYLSGKILDTPVAPNWDGTLEKPEETVVQPKKPTDRKRSEETQAPNGINPPNGGVDGDDEKEKENMLPPSPMSKMGKKG